MDIFWSTLIIPATVIEATLHISACIFPFLLLQRYMVRNDIGNMRLRDPLSGRASEDVLIGIIHLITPVTTTRRVRTED